MYVSVYLAHYYQILPSTQSIDKTTYICHRIQNLYFSGKKANVHFTHTYNTFTYANTCLEHMRTYTHIIQIMHAYTYIDKCNQLAIHTYVSINTHMYACTHTHLD